MGIFQDVHFDNRHIYYNRYAEKPRYIKVVVEFNEDDVGRVVTAFFADAAKAGEKMIWSIQLSI